MAVLLHTAQPLSCFKRGLSQTQILLYINLYLAAQVILLLLDVWVLAGKVLTRVLSTLFWLTNHLFMNKKQSQSKYVSNKKNFDQVDNLKESWKHLLKYLLQSTKLGGWQPCLKVSTMNFSKWTSKNIFYSKMVCCIFRPAFGWLWQQKMNARPNNNQLITYYLTVCYLLRIQQYPVNTTYNSKTNLPPCIRSILLKFWSIKYAVIFMLACIKLQRYEWADLIVSK